MPLLHELRQWPLGHRSAERRVLCIRLQEPAKWVEGLVTALAKATLRQRGDGANFEYAERGSSFTTKCRQMLAEWLADADGSQSRPTTSAVLCDDCLIWERGSPSAASAVIWPDMSLGQAACCKRFVWEAAQLPCTDM
mmetsp:Transcript_61523/g.146720  ORF Transcript_61523/g.146720 Transcript_61523/m.146720 type:complete len:138 (-) Transcript_61523:549-962(-)